MPEVPDRRPAFAAKNLLAAFLILLFAISLFYGWFNVRYQPAFPIGDWLINYSQGFVRRGLPGQFLLIISHLLRLPVPWMALAVPAMIYAAFLFGVYKLASGLRSSFLWFGMLFSPAGLCFIVLNLFFDGYRKEILLFAALTGMIFLLRAEVSAKVLSLLLVGMLSILVLSHEAMALCFPYFFAAVALHKKSLKQAAAICAIPFCVAAILFILVGHYPGDLAVAKGICSSVGGRWMGTADGSQFPGMSRDQSLCSGSIAWLTVTLAEYHLQELQVLHFWKMYSVCWVLSFAPFVLALIVLYRRDKLRYEARVIGWTATLCAVGSLGLFYSTIDWGRWIHSQIICLMLVILAAAQRADSFRSVRAESGERQARRGWTRSACVLITVLYCTCWTLPLGALLTLRYGYVQSARRLHRVMVDRVHWNESVKAGLYGEPTITPQ